MLLLVLLIKESAGDNHQIAHNAVVGKNSKYGDVAFFASADWNAVAQRDHRGCRNNTRHLPYRSLHIINGQRIRSDVGDTLASALIFSFNLICTDSLNLVQHILLTGHANSDYQNQGSGSDHHPQSSQREANLVAKESLIGET